MNWLFGVGVASQSPASLHSKPRAMNHIPRKVLFTVIKAIEYAMRPFGLDVFTVLDDSGQGPFTFDRADHGNGDREYWGLGLHVTVSPLRMRP